MTSATKAADIARRKPGYTKAGQPSLVVNLNVKSASLRRLLQGDAAKEDTPSDPEVTLSPESAAQTGQAGNAKSETENPPESNTATPQPADGTPVPSIMGPPSDGGKKRGVKRAAPNGNGGSDGPSKPRKSSSKKKQKL